MSKKKEQEDFERYTDTYYELSPEEYEALDDIATLNNEEMEQEYRYQMELEASYKGDKFLSEVLDIDREVENFGNKLVIVAGVGAGKSSWVKNVLTKKPIGKRNVLFVTSRRAKVEEDTVHSLFDSKLDIEDKRPVWHTLVTNSKLAYFIMELCMQEDKDSHELLDKFLDRYNYIVIDEVHALAADSTYAESSFHVKAFMEYAVAKGKIVIAMTGTPQPIFGYFLKNKWRILDFTKQCKYVKPLRIDKIKKNKVQKRIASELEAKRKVIYFINHISQIKELCQNLTQTNEVTGKPVVKPENLAVIVSQTRNEELNSQLKEILGDESEKTIKMSTNAYNQIVKQRLLPEKCKILISTATLREGIDILNENVTVICENHILSNIIQFCGRTRLGGSVFYIVENEKQHMIQNNQLLYEYACKEELDAANRFYLGNLVEGKSIQLKKQLISHVEKNPYIRFNYIQRKFEIDEMRYQEELRLKRSLDAWESDLKDHCDRHGILNYYMNPYEKKCFIIRILGQFASKEIRLYEKGERDTLCHLLYAMLKLDRVYKQPRELNSKLEKYGYMVTSKKDNTKEKRDKTYWIVEKIKDEEH